MKTSSSEVSGETHFFGRQWSKDTSHVAQTRDLFDRFGLSCHTREL